MDAFVAAMQRKKRRRRILRRLAAGGALAALVAAAAPAVTTPPPAEDTSVLVVSPAADRSPPLDGFRIGSVPDGLRADPRDGSSVCLAAAAMRECRDPRAGDPTATGTLRRYDRDGSAWLWISVLRPQATTPAVDRARITRWLVDWQTVGAQRLSSFDSPVGRASVLATEGSEVTVHSVVVTTDDGVVIAISGVADLSADDLTAVAQHLTPAR